MSTDLERIQALQGGTRRWYDIGEERFVTATTVFIPFGCPDWGAPGGVRKPQLCPFCNLPDAAIAYQQEFYGGPIALEELARLFRLTLRAALESTPETHTLNIFNGGSFLYMPFELQAAVIRSVREMADVRRLVIESRANFITPERVDPLLELLGPVALTIRVGVETKEHHLRTKVLPKGQSVEQLVTAGDCMRQRGVTSGGYVLLKPAPGYGGREALAEAEATIEWIVGSENDSLGMNEAYFCAACVPPKGLLFEAWRAAAFQPATLSMVFEVIRFAAERFGRRVHLLPFTDVPPFVAIPSNHVPQGIPEDLTGATGCDLAFHAMFEKYRQTLDKAVLVEPSCPLCDQHSFPGSMGISP
ncbi:MAG TPA: hypothetical protein VF173_06285 [Thermoanaerobaculia bacterium]|nr:hypothetical protein [Thermoanaerobaculia bacterium]